MTPDPEQLRRKLDDLPRWQREIEQDLADWSPQTGGRRSAVIAGTVPGLELLSVAQSLGPGGWNLARLASWESDWRERRSMPQRVRPGTLDEVCAWLGVHVEWAVGSHPAVDEFADELREVVAETRAVLGSDERWLRMHLRHEEAEDVPCHKRLWVDRLDPGDPRLGCRACDAWWTLEGLGDILDLPLPIKDVCEFTGVGEAALRQAMKRGTLDNRGDWRHLRVSIRDVTAWRAGISA